MSNTLKLFPVLWPPRSTATNVVKTTIWKSIFPRVFTRIFSVRYSFSWLRGFLSIRVPFCFRSETMMYSLLSRIRTRRGFWQKASVKSLSGKREDSGENDYRTKPKRKLRSVGRKSERVELVIREGEVLQSRKTSDRSGVTGTLEFPEEEVEDVCFKWNGFVFRNTLRDTPYVFNILSQ